jgi:hypothetical protein
MSKGGLVITAVVIEKRLVGEVIADYRMSKSPAQLVNGDANGLGGADGSAAQSADRARGQTPARTHTLVWHLKQSSRHRMLNDSRRIG